MAFHRAHDDFAAEIESHLELEQEALVEDGLTNEDAFRTAARTFGNRVRSQEQFYERGRWIWWDDVRRDIQYAARGYRRHPGFAVAVGLTLALAIGANTAVFTIADEALFRPLPVPRADQLTAVYSFNQKIGSFQSSSYPDYEDYRIRATSFQDLAAYLRMPLDVTIQHVRRSVSAEAVTANYFRTLEIAPLLGATFSAPDAREVLISEQLWRARFGSNTGALGQTFNVVDQPYTIVGVIPGSYRGLNLNWGEPADLWFPIDTIGLLLPRFETAQLLRRRDVRGLVLFGRRKPGVTIAQSQSELQAVAASLAHDNPRENADITAVALDASRSKFWPAYRDRVALALGAFGSAAFLVLLLACANISNLLLERALARRREIAIRLTMGASRTRLIRQMLVESLFLVLPSFGGALFVGHVLAGFVARFHGALGTGLVLDAAMDLRVLLFGCAVALGVTLWFGLLPALSSTRAGAHATLKQSSQNVAATSAPWLREILLVIQISITTILLVGCGLFSRSLMAERSKIDFGDHVIIAGLDRAAAARVPQLSQQLREAAIDLPGVVFSSTAADVPLTPGLIGLRLFEADGTYRPLSYNVVGSDYFRTMSIRLLAGRGFGEIDDATASPVAVVSRTLARQISPSGNAIGDIVTIQESDETPKRVEIIGVAADVPDGLAIWSAPRPLLYLSERQSAIAPRHWILRTSGPAGATVRDVRRAWERLAPNIALGPVQTTDDIVNEVLAPQRLAAGLFLSFGALALLLAAIGIYGLTAFSVGRRTREIGIRMALGARPASAIRQIIGRTLALAAAAVLIGAVGSAGLAHFAAPLARSVSPYDAMTFAGVAGLLTVIAVLAAWVPARRASRIDPLVALRLE